MKKAVVAGILALGAVTVGAQAPSRTLLGDYLSSEMPSVKAIESPAAAPAPKKSGNLTESSVTRPVYKDDDAPPVPTGCPSIDLVPLSAGITALNVNGDRLGEFADLQMGKVGQQQLRTGRRVTFIPMIKEDGGGPSTGCKGLPMGFGVFPSRKALYVGKNQVGTYGRFSPSAQILQQVSTRNTNKFTLKGNPYSMIAKDAKDSGDSDVVKTVVKVVKDFAAGTGTAAGAALGVFFTPSKIGCGKGEQCSH